MIFKFVREAETAAKSAGYDVTTPSGVKVCYIYAGRWCPGINVATTLNGPKMAVPERDHSNCDPGEASSAKLAHFGFFYHEFVHMMGAAHSHRSVYNWCLMMQGHKNGDVYGNTPASVNPWILCKSVLGKLMYAQQ